ncbi:MAG TPA: hypothetical protein VJU61_15340 [Polyangiaceae bacterium]|nr:hypothetical protein [Polyangiaceae bacterium]
MQQLLLSRFSRARVSHIGAALGLILACTPATQQTPDPSVPGATAAPDGAQLGSVPSATAAGQPVPLERAAVEDSEPGWGIVEPPEKPVTYAEVVRRVTGMVTDGGTQAEVQRRGLHLLNLTWEDTGRDQGSALGPNISDLTLQVRYTEQGDRKAALLPVIRLPNFSDRTGDVRADKFFLRVGNQANGGRLETVALRDVLANVKAYLSDPGSVLGSGNLTAQRDSHYLVSAQAVFLPIPSQGKAEFTPVLFNYQSFPGSPAVLTLLVSRQGTSTTIIDNRQNQASPVESWGQELYFNERGKRAPFSAERKTDVKARIDAQGGPRTEDDRSALARGADALFIIQVPLRQKAQRRAPLEMLGSASGAGAMAESAPAPAAAPAKSAAAPRSDVEQAVLGHGRVEGKFEEGQGLRLERDDRFPVRVTIQFYKATSNGVVDSTDLDAIATSIGNVYEHADYVGSLVIPEGDARRPTDWHDAGRLFPY